MPAFAQRSLSLYADALVIALYSVAVVLGACALVAWVVMGVLAERPGATAADPEGRYGTRGRAAVAGVLGFGLGGMSSSYAGWPVATTIVAAAAGAVFLVVAGSWLAVGDDHA